MLVNVQYQDLLEIGDIRHFLEPAHAGQTGIVHKMIHFKSEK
jgi:hypothetical protein